MSTIFTPSDEAFALMIIYNEKDRWDSKPETENTTIDPTSEPVTKKKRWDNPVQKRFCSGMSGSRDGWSKEGKRVFRHLKNQIVYLRQNNTTGVVFEKLMREKWKGDADRRRTATNKKAKTYDVRRSGADINDDGSISDRDEEWMTLLGDCDETPVNRDDGIPLTVGPEI